ncbi:MAG: hypothetical protein DRP46_06050 [Candidatus Zixiibacteriota bacterium]|nr:MAG: hypothetical protein DRP46_06050 [candidate division Zixibacteria bacterium]
MDYNNLLTRAFNLSWKHKVLWVLGFLATSMGYFGGFDLSDKHVFEKFHHWQYNVGGDFTDRIIDWFEFNPEISAALVLFIVAMLLLLFLIFFVLNLISIAGLIEGVYKIEREEPYRLGKLFKAGASFFWRFLGLFLLAVVVVVAVLFVIILPIVLAFIITPVLGVLALLIGIPVGIAAAFFFGNVYSLAQREIVAYQTPIIQAVGEAFHLLIKHIIPNLVIFLITTFLWIVIVIGATIIAILFAIPIMMLATQSVWILLGSLFVILPLFLLIAIVVEGFLGTFFNSLMTLFYLELRKLSPRGGIPTAAPEPGFSQS